MRCSGRFCPACPRECHDHGPACSGPPASWVDAFAALASEERRYRVAVRHAIARAALCTRRAWTLFPSSPPTCAIRPRSPPPSAAGPTAVVDAVSAYVETGGVRSRRARARRAITLAREALLPVSALLSSFPPHRRRSLRRFRTSARADGELAVQQVFPGATIVRSRCHVRPATPFRHARPISSTTPSVCPDLRRATRGEPAYVEDVSESNCAHPSPILQTVEPTYELAALRVYNCCASSS